MVGIRVTHAMATMPSMNVVDVERGARHGRVEPKRRCGMNVGKAVLGRVNREWQAREDWVCPRHARLQVAACVACNRCVVRERARTSQACSAVVRASLPE